MSSTSGEVSGHPGQYFSDIRGFYRDIYDIFVGYGEILRAILKGITMKRAFFSLGAALCAGAVLVSCNGTFGTQDYVSHAAMALQEGGTDSLVLDINVSYPVSGMDKTALGKVGTFLTAEYFGEEYAGLDPEEAIKAYTDDITAEYREENLGIAQDIEDGKIPSMTLRHEEYIKGEMYGSHKNIFSYKTSKYVFAGGAHGMTAETAFNFDMKTGEPVVETDFFKEGYSRKLTGLLSAHLPEALESPADTSMMFIREIEPNGNFCVSNEGVTYIYNQYEIAPYAMGIIRITIPWEELEGLY